jgi:PTH1 family peptidyl-tRNA hydrolase
LPAIFGLGNPGPKYKGTRHNVGFEVIDALAIRWGADRFDSLGSALIARLRPPAGGEPVVLGKPMTFMNASGEAVAGVVAYYKIDPKDVLVVLDEVQLPLGRLRLRPSGSAGGHNGLKSVIEHMGAEVPRLRVGVGRGDERWDLADHVLARFSPDERDIVDRAVARAADAVELFVTGGILAAMNQFNAASSGEIDAAGPADRSSDDW